MPDEPDSSDSASDTTDTFSNSGLEVNIQIHLDLILKLIMDGLHTVLTHFSWNCERLVLCDQHMN